jgi:MOSC domain-containing protein YiiM
MITKDQLFEQYDKKVDAILDVCDWKTNFTSEEVCGIVYKILEQNNINTSIPVEQFHNVYLEAVGKVWNTDITMRQITDIVHDTLLSKNIVE